MSHRVRPWSVAWATTTGTTGLSRAYALTPAEALAETVKALPAAIRATIRNLEVQEA